MAPKPMQIDTLAKAAAAVCVSSITILAGFPEFGVLLFLLACALVPSQKRKEWQRSLAVKHPRLSSAFKSSLSKAFALVCIVALLVVVLGWSSQTAIVFLTAACYLMVHELNKLEKARFVTRCQASVDTPLSQQVTRSSSSSRQSLDTDAAAPIRAHTGFDEAADGTLRGDTVAADDEVIVSHLVQFTRECILPVVPEADITAIAPGSLRLLSGKCAKPEVNITVTVDPSILRERLKAFFVQYTAHSHKSMDTLLPDLLQTTAVKVLSERLLFARFWRSHFSGSDPRVVLRVPSELGLLDRPLYLNVRVNAPYP